MFSIVLDAETLSCEILSFFFQEIYLKVKCISRIKSYTLFNLAFNLLKNKINMILIKKYNGYFLKGLYIKRFT